MWRTDAPSPAPFLSAQVYVFFLAVPAAPAELRFVNTRANIEMVYGPFIKIKTRCTFNRDDKGFV